MIRVFAVAVVALGLSTPLAYAQKFVLQPAVALEAEDFTIEQGWQVIRNGQGNYMVDIVGFNHISGERLLGIDEKDDTASAYHDVILPEAGPYRLHVRYEYPAFCETRFRVVLEQNGKVVLDQVLGKKDSLRYGFGDPIPKAQHDPSWGSEGLFEEAVSVPALQKGKARIYLKGASQPQIPGVTARRHIDLVYLTRDTADAWRKHYATRVNLYPILEAFRDTRGPRWEVRFTNRGTAPLPIRISHVYNRIPWGMSEPATVPPVQPGASSEWIGLAAQDTAHFSMVDFSGPKVPFDVELRPAGGKVERKLSGVGQVRVYLPPYPGKGEQPTTPVEAIDAILAELARTKPIGRKPTLPLCYGGWMPLGLEDDYGRKYAELYATLGFRSLHPAHSGPAVLKNLEAAGVPRSKSWMVMGYRNPPTPGNIERARTSLNSTGLGKELRFFDYGDEIAFAEWLGMLTDEEITQAKAKGEKVTADQVLARRWVEWLRANRPKGKLGDYWLAKWGAFQLGRMRPDSSALAARENPRLYVDSLLFYEEEAIRFAARGARAVKSAFGEDVLCGANYSGHPFYYPHSTMYIKWFRGGAADLGRHSEYFWQVGQPGPMINGYFAEHFLAGMRHNPRAVLRQYTMPHSPGNTDASFLRSAFSHLAHGATMLDFFGIGLNESFTENHIDHRDKARYRALRDVTHAVGFVEDLLPDSRPVPSRVALLISESTERWDHAGTAVDRAGHNHFGPDFRKTRLHFHLDRLGIWTALTFLGSTPDLVTEDDLAGKELDRFQVLVLVGDCLPAELAPRLEAWVKKGGVILATATCGRFDPYREANPAMNALFGLKDRQVIGPEVTFLRPRQELPFLLPANLVLGKDWHMPQLAVAERVEVLDKGGVRAHLKAGKGPAVVERELGKGRIWYVAAHPGLAYLWSALRPPRVPDRGPASHTVPTEFDPGAQALLEQVLQSAKVEPAIVAKPNRIDARLLRASQGYILPLANYQGSPGQKVTLSVQVDRPIRKVTSAVHGELKATMESGRVLFTLPGLGYGDVLRLEP
jgi:hypothetical protein